ncbi:Ankyrin repeat domain-containing protein 1 [Pseudocercospora fuligena]|uniref:Ankyrin repeat domain-containing protein 1 n=1 Tax=Pseudocercospora fuligena TaxID=685502 RepID=A0A8H6RBN0_9PEZI|nr:Ankyrin repeat domain-containing protein 1 [Pseudocercospora fuligena]
MTERGPGDRRRSGDQKNWTGNVFSGDSRNHNGDVNGNITNNNYYGSQKGGDPTVFEQTNKDLIRAASTGSTKLVKWLLNQGYSPNYRGSYELTALHHAALSGNVETVDTLLDAGFDANVRSEIWGTPLHLAVLRSHFNVMEALCKEGADLLQPCRVLGTVLHCAYYAGNEHMIDILNIKEAPELESTEASVCLSWMRSLQRCSTLSSMLKSLAIEDHPEEIMDVLVCTPIYMAVIANKSRLINKISASLFDVTRLSKTFSVRTSELFAASAPLDTWHCTHLTDILTFVVKSTDRSALELLLKAGLNCNARCTPLDMTPLMTAASMGLTDVVEMLLDYEALPDLSDEQGHNAQWYVTTHVQDPETREQLIDMLRVREGHWAEKWSNKTSSRNITQSPYQGVSWKTTQSINQSSMCMIRRKSSFDTDSSMKGEAFEREKKGDTSLTGKGYESDHAYEKPRKAGLKAASAFEPDYVTIDIPSAPDASMYRPRDSLRHSDGPITTRFRSAPPKFNAHSSANPTPHRGTEINAAQSTSALDLADSAQHATILAKSNALENQQQHLPSVGMASFVADSIGYDPTPNEPYRQQSSTFDPHEIQNPYNQAPPPSFRIAKSSQ